MRRLGAIMGIAALALGAGVSIGRSDEDLESEPRPRPKRAPAAPRIRVTPKFTGSIAAGNRHGGEHQHAREIARRSRQSAFPAPS